MIQVKLSPMKVTTKTYKGAHGFTLKLTKKGKGGLPKDLPVQEKGKDEYSITAKKGLLEFWEKPGKGDASKSARHIGTLDGNIWVKDTDKGKVPIFSAFSMKAETAAKESDFVAHVKADEKTVTIGYGMSLPLPWEYKEEGSKMEIGVKLKIDGAVHSDLKHNDSIDIPLKHKNVPEDGSGKKKLACFGAGMVYATSNALLKSSQKIKAASVTVHVHESVKKGCDNTHSGSYDFAKLSSFIKDTFTSGGLTVTVNEVKTDSSSGKKRVGTYLGWHSGTRRFVADGIKKPSTVLTAGVYDDEGSDVPFFEYYVMHNNNVGGHLGEAGDSEVLNPMKPVNVSKKTKRLLFPICLVGRFDPTYAAVSKAGDRMKFVANVITHEVGHSLGLYHALWFGGSSYSKETSLGVMTNLGVSGGEVTLSKFSPVEKALIKKHFL